MRSARGRAREAILDAIRAAEPLSRVEIAAATGLTEASVSMTVRRLLDEGLVVETGRTPTAGKPRTLLRLDPAARIAVGVYLDAGRATFVLTGQTGGIISRLARPLSSTPSGAAVSAVSADELAAGVVVLLAGSGVDAARCAGIGLAGSGLPVTLGGELSAATGMNVLVENEATAAAIGEYWVARLGPERSFAALHMGSGIGAGIVVGGQALRGGEFGHFCVRVDGPPCWCGARGCLEAVAGPRAVVAAASANPQAAAEAELPLSPAAASPHPAPGPRGFPPGSRQPAGSRQSAGSPQSAGSRGVAADFAAVARAARAGAPACLALLEESATYVAAAAESVVNLLDLDLVVLTGAGFAAASFVYGPAIQRRIAPADARTWHRAVTVTVSLAAATASATGAAALVLQPHLRH
ncbi:putative ROK-family transcriptional regulator [Actinoplanes missouriensis 431]|uniref:Putative ROK-family transcriptional regulator n=1 Tax=Actinoplanes missouriensis (strain ATCC 14538 / DSM 43046 / CBS 188.64 / JCM 3121 / NBRC 102363 / NCIMB 12654 / NRRL B-3342 / UNCC 431) TaxID=512565 RepID=I0H8C8_ACTM4|nr:ROK family transcriptional regulator [Actinoplanes missouriensis]BAL89265.1 putative ROK-family transcriptional regulator [Actinoplanes missouriensis 431]